MQSVINTETIPYIAYYIILINKTSYLKYKNQFRSYLKTHTQIQSTLNLIKFKKIDIYIYIYNIFKKNNFLFFFFQKAIILYLFL